MAGESTGDRSDTPVLSRTARAAAMAGGWGVLIRRGAEEESRRVRDDNNRSAAIEALQEVPPGGAARSIPTAGVKDGITRWIAGKANPARKPVKNRDLGGTGRSGGRRIEWRWVKGHAGNQGKPSWPGRLAPFLPEDAGRAGNDSASQCSTPMAGGHRLSGPAFGFREQVYEERATDAGHVPEWTCRTAVQHGVFPEMGQTTPDPGLLPMRTTRIGRQQLRRPTGSSASAIRAEDLEGHRWIASRSANQKRKSAR